MRLSYLFAHLHLLSSYSFSSILLSSNLSLLSASSLLCFSSVHIVGSLTSKLPSIITYIYDYTKICNCHVTWSQLEAPSAWKKLNWVGFLVNQCAFLTLRRQQCGWNGVVFPGKDPTGLMTELHFSKGDQKCGTHWSWSAATSILAALGGDWRRMWVCNGFENRFWWLQWKSEKDTAKQIHRSMVAAACHCSPHLFCCATPSAYPPVCPPPRPSVFTHNPFTHNFLTHDFVTHTHTCSELSYRI